MNRQKYVLVKGRLGIKLRFFGRKLVQRERLLVQGTLRQVLDWSRANRNEVLAQNVMDQAVMLWRERACDQVA